MSLPSSKFVEILPRPPRIAWNQQEAAQMLGISPSTLSRERRLGRIRPGPLGLYSLEILNNYLNQGIR